MYINLMIEINKKKYVCFWLLLITFLVAIMIIVGGLTRLTDSGLSITEWQLFSGILPPLDTNDWNYYFSLYKTTSEYKLINSSMTLEEFKVIYWWEFIHRILGRIIGLAFILPLIYFSWKKSIHKSFLFPLYSISVLILIQGLIGWYMVKSGLVDRTDVSQYRLSLHLTVAFIIFILLLWNFLKYNDKRINFSYKKLPFSLPLIFLLFIVFQISIGAFVSGLDAGRIYQTWPLMNESYFPDDSNFTDLFSLKVLELPSVVQFLHRNLAYFIFFLFLLILIIVFKNKDFAYLKRDTLLVFASLVIQIFLGIITVISGAQIIIASMHQIGSIILVSTSLILVFKNSKIS